MGGELVYNKQTASEQKTSAGEISEKASVTDGKELFEKKCSACHLADSPRTKVGPGLKGLFQKEKMQVSGWPVSEENLKRQLKKPFDQMPAFDQLTDKEITALTGYIKTL
ncbi:MAG: cytochrome c [Desulfarculaceae bacterium]|nr:cytochrome c [Desulfarculaceae bacterium]